MINDAQWDHRESDQNKHTLGLGFAIEISGADLRIIIGWFRFGGKNGMLKVRIDLV